MKISQVRISGRSGEAGYANFKIVITGDRPAGYELMKDIEVFYLNDHPKMLDRLDIQATHYIEGNIIKPYTKWTPMAYLIPLRLLKDINGVFWYVSSCNLHDENRASEINLDVFPMTHPSDGSPITVGEAAEAEAKRNGTLQVLVPIEEPKPKAWTVYDMMSNQEYELPDDIETFGQAKELIRERFVAARGETQWQYEIESPSGERMYFTDPDHNFWGLCGQKPHPEGVTFVVPGSKKRR